jgi:hypothetical protein
LSAARAKARCAAALAAAVLAAGCGSPLSGEPQKPAPGGPVALTRTLVYEDAGRLDWCHGNNQLAFDRSTRAGSSEVWTVDADGQNDRCLTCDLPGLPKGLRGQPAWHPSCRWLVIQVSNRHARGGRYEQLAWGIHHDLWAIAADRSFAVPLVSGGPLQAALDPHFSRDGTRLLWSARQSTGRRIVQKAGQRTPGAENPWEGWHLSHAPVAIGRDGRPRLGARVDLFRGSPDGGFYQGHALTADTVWFSHTARGLPYVDDVYRARADGSNLVNLTRSPGIWDQYGSPAPAGKLVAFSSSAPFPWRHPPDGIANLRLELFALASDGRRVQLTHLSEQLAGEGGGRGVIGEHAWGPGGKQIAFLYEVFEPDGAPERRIGVIELGELR